MKAKQKKGSLSVLIVLIVAIVLVISVTFAAIFRHSMTITRLFQVSNLSAQSVVWFDGVSESDMGQYKTEYGVLASIDPSDANYIGKLRAKVQYKGRGVGLVRVRMVEEWSTPNSYTRTVEEEVDGDIVQRQETVDYRTVLPYKLDMTYTLDSAFTGSGNQRAWYDNRTADYCFYYATPVYSIGDTARDIPLITGVNTENIDLGLLPSDAQIHVLFEADVVQVNRYQQYWNITSLPWLGADSSTELEVSNAASP